MTIKLQNKPVVKWDPEDTRAWLERIGLSEYASLLCDQHRIDGPALLMIQEEDLKKAPLCLTVLGHIKKIMFHINQLRYDFTPESARLLYCLGPCPTSTGLPRPRRDNSMDSSSSESSSSFNKEREAHEFINGQVSRGMLCESCDTSLHRSSSNVATNLKRERWKTGLAMLYGLFVSWLTALVMTVVHDRVPDMNKYPPLPDIILDNLPHIPWAFELCEITGTVLLSVWTLVLLFHKHRFILARRFFSIAGTIFLLRCVTMLITSLSVPGQHLDCKPRPYGTWTTRLQNAYIIWSGAGMSIQGVRTCGDYMFSGHTVSLTLLNFFITEYTSRRIYFLHTFTWLCNMFGIFFILAAHEHYSIDVFIAFYITSRLFLYYHTLVNNRALAISHQGSDAKRTWFYFPLFSFFEQNINGRIPNEFELPLSPCDVKSFAFRIVDCGKQRLNSLYKKPSQLSANNKTSKQEKRKRR